jgi:hypothetical protein
METQRPLNFKMFEILVKWIMQLVVRDNSYKYLCHILLSILKFIENSEAIPGLEIFEGGRVNTKNFQLLGVSYYIKYALHDFDESKYKWGEIICDKVYTEKQIKQVSESLPYHTPMIFTESSDDESFDFENIDIVFIILNGSTQIRNNMPLHFYNREKKEFSPFSISECLKVIQKIYNINDVDADNYIEAYNNLKRQASNLKKFNSLINNSLLAGKELYALLYKLEENKNFRRENTSLSNNFKPDELKFYSLLKKSEERLFDDMCNDFDAYTGKKLGNGKYGSAYDVNKTSDVIEYFGDRDIVVKDVSVKGIKDCITRNLLIQTKNNDPVILDKVFQCKGKNTAIGEFFINMFVSALNSVNFIDTYVYKDCGIDKKQFIFMEKIDGTLSELFEELSKNEDREDRFKKTDVITIQLLHAIWCMHEHKINHNDCHNKNIFYIKVNENTTIIDKGTRRKLNNYDYVEYNFGSRKIYIPVSDIQYIIKFGDFGLSAKYSDPYILNAAIDSSSYLDYFSPIYDLMILFQNTSYYTSPFYKMIQLYLLGVNTIVDIIYKQNTDIEGFKEWWKAHESEMDENCQYVKKIKGLVDTDDHEKINMLSKNNNYLSTFCLAVYYNDNKEDKNRRQNYNFLLSEMKNKESINVNNLITHNFFIKRMEELGYVDKPPNSDKVVTFGGPGFKK